MSSPVTVKRRRLNDAASRLRKPFVSPLRNAQPVRTPRGQSALIVDQPYTPSTHAHTINPAALAGLSASQSGSEGSPAVVDITTPSRKQASFMPASRLKPSSEEVAMQKEISGIERQIRQITSELDALKQARRISSSAADADLQALSDKWRTASQAVAEELFGSVKERVYRMGGVAAWRDSEKNKFERANGMGGFAQEPEPEDDDADCEFDSEGEELPEKEQEYRKETKRRAKQEMMDAAEVPDEPDEELDAGAQKTKVWMDHGKDDDTFTMDMMLRSLNIPLELIGYDKELQKWSI